MKLTTEQYNELKESLASEAIHNMEKEASEKANENNEILTDEKIAEIIEAKKALIKEASEQEAQEKEASEDDAEEMAKKAFEVYQYALNKIAACQEMYNDGIAGQEACIQILAEAGMYDENGFNKEAAEESEETINFANKVAESYDDSMNKIAAAEECYAEAIEEANAALEVIAACGYEVEE